MTNSRKSKIIIIISTVILAVVVVVFAILNMKGANEKRILEKNAEFVITCNGESKTLNMEQVLSLNPKEFKAIMDTSTTLPTEVEFTGVEFKTLFDFCKFNLDGKSSVEVTSLDGYASALTIDEINMTDNVFLCIKMNGLPLGKKSENGLGPYLMVINSAKYSQRWCKFVGEIEIK